MFDNNKDDEIYENIKISSYLFFFNFSIKNFLLKIEQKFAFDIRGKWRD